MLDDVLENLLAPRRFLRALVEAGRVRWGLWALYAGIALVGTGFFGFTFGLVYTGSGSPLWWACAITAAAGAGWAVFAPIVVWMLGSAHSKMGGAHACLVTMVYGEAVLEVGAVLNLIGYWKGTLGAEHALAANGALVVVANAAMALAIAVQLRELGVAVWRTVALWMVVLNGVGAGFFWLLYRGVGAG